MASFWVRQGVCVCVTLVWLGLGECFRLGFGKIKQPQFFLDSQLFLRFFFLGGGGNICYIWTVLSLRRRTPTRTRTKLTKPSHQQQALRPNWRCDSGANRTREDHGLGVLEPFQFVLSFFSFKSIWMTSPVVYSRLVNSIVWHMNVCVYVWCCDVFVCGQRTLTEKIASQEREIGVLRAKVTAQSDQILLLTKQVFICLLFRIVFFFLKSWIVIWNSTIPSLRTAPSSCPSGAQTTPT